MEFVRLRNECRDAHDRGAQHRLDLGPWIDVNCQRRLTWHEEVIIVRAPIKSRILWLGGTIGPTPGLSFVREFRRSAVLWRALRLDLVLSVSLHGSFSS